MKKCSECDRFYDVTGYSKNQFSKNCASGRCKGCVKPESAATTHLTSTSTSPSSTFLINSSRSSSSVLDTNNSNSDEEKEDADSTTEGENAEKLRASSSLSSLSPSPSSSSAEENGEDKDGSGNRDVNTDDNNAEQLRSSSSSAVSSSSYSSSSSSSSGNNSDEHEQFGPKSSAVSLSSSSAQINNGRALNYFYLDYENITYGEHKDAFNNEFTQLSVMAASNMGALLVACANSSNGTVEVREASIIAHDVLKHAGYELQQRPGLEGTTFKRNSKCISIKDGGKYHLKLITRVSNELSLVISGDESQLPPGSIDMIKEALKVLKKTIGNVEADYNVGGRNLRPRTTRSRSGEGTGSEEKTPKTPRKKRKSSGNTASSKKAKKNMEVLKKIAQLQENMEVLLGQVNELQLEIQALKKTFCD